MIGETLTGLRDVDDVHGSFLLSEGGQLVARDLPSVFHSELFAEVGPRLVRLRETLEAEGEAVSTLTLRFADHKLHLRTIGQLLLGVVTTSKVNGPALRMALNLVTKRLAVQASELPAAAAAPPPETDVSAPPIGTRRAPGIMGRTDIRFRGQKL
jgi:predicted regulator of Ras-like GTPase activity (Roadblock/LC7/MglB family)